MGGRRSIVFSFPLIAVGILSINRRYSSIVRQICQEKVLRFLFPRSHSQFSVGTKVATPQTVVYQRFQDIVPTFPLVLRFPIWKNKCFCTLTDKKYFFYYRDYQNRWELWDCGNGLVRQLFHITPALWWSFDFFLVTLFTRSSVNVRERAVAGVFSEIP